jgi:hypothetical protein
MTVMPEITTGVATLARTVCSGFAVSDETGVSSVRCNGVPDGTSIGIIVGNVGLEAAEEAVPRAVGDSPVADEAGARISAPGGAAGLSFVPPAGAVVRAFPCGCDAGWSLPDPHATITQRVTESTASRSTLPIPLPSQIPSPES